jgi:hypothetical protein
MRLRPPAWLLELRGLGHAFGDVLLAEWAALTADLSRSAWALLRGLALVASAIVIMGWVAGLLSLGLISFLDQYLPLWVAVLIVAASLAAIAWMLFLRGRATLRRLQTPLALAKRHVEGHVEWLQGELRGSPLGDDDDDHARDEAG